MQQLQQVDHRVVQGEVVDTQPERLDRAWLSQPGRAEKQQFVGFERHELAAQPEALLAVGQDEQQVLAGGEGLEVQVDAWPLQAHGLIQAQARPPVRTQPLQRSTDPGDGEVTIKGQMKGKDRREGSRRQGRRGIVAHAAAGGIQETWKMSWSAPVARSASCSMVIGVANI